MEKCRHRNHNFGNVIRRFSGKVKWLLILTVLVSSAILVFGLNGRGASTLPVYSLTDFAPELIDPSLVPGTQPHRVGAFTLINQHGKTITEKEYEGKVFVTDFFFTRCPTICPKMSKHMYLIQEATKDLPLLLLSISVTPEYDSVPVLREYAIKHHADSERWNLTTGDKTHIYDLARKEFFAAYNESDGGLQDFIHTSNFVLVDLEKQIRGIYEGTDEEEVERLIEDVRLLLRN